jgi:hypothetical protein
MVLVKKKKSGFSVPSVVHEKNELRPNKPRKTERNRIA